MASHTVNRSITAYEQLRAGIVAGRWPSGEHVSTYRLAEELGMSRTPVIEALKRLEADGLLEIVPQVGCRVLPGASDPSETFLVRTAMEGLAAEVAAPRIDAEQLAGLDASLAGAEAAVAARDAEAFDAADHAFHLTIVRASALAHVERILHGIWTLNRLQVACLPGDAGTRATSNDEHRRILRALRDRDAAAARSALEDHLRRCERDLRAGARR